MRIAIVALALLLPMSAAMAAPDYKAIELAAVDKQIAPGFRQFADRATALHASAEAFCKKPDTQGLNAVRAGFNDVMDAWQGVQHITFGPVELFNRGQRVQFWPDKRNAGERQLLALLRDRKTEGLDLPHLAVVSVGIQGLPALEMLLFGQGQADKLLVPGEDATFRCRLVTLIPANLAAIGNDLAQEFSKPDGFRAAIEGAGTSGSRYANDREAALQLFNTLFGQLQAIAEVKLTYPMGSKADEARAGRSESWRSKRSLRNIIVNLEALKATFAASFTPALAAEGQAEISERFTTMLDQTIAAARQLPPMEDAMTKADGWKSLAMLKVYVKASAKILEEAGIALGLQVGFNALDGD
jgi:predicted lipoprotein